MDEYVGEPLQFLALLRERLLHGCFFSGVPDDTTDRLLVDIFFGDIVRRAALHRLRCNGRITLAGRHDDEHIGTSLVQGGHAIEPIATREVVVHNSEIEDFPLAFRQRQVDADGLHAFTCDSRLLDGAPDLLAITRIIVDDQDRQGVTGGVGKALTHGSSTTRQ